MGTETKLTYNGRELNSNLQFLYDLESRVVKHKIEKIQQYCRPSELIEADFPDWTRGEIISPEEISRIQEIVVEEDFLLYPSSTNFGFAVRYVVEDVIPSNLGLRSGIKHMLCFKDGQVKKDPKKPHDQIYEQLAETFRRDRNYELAKVAGFDKRELNGLFEGYSYHD